MSAARVCHLFRAVLVPNRTPQIYYPKLPHYNSLVQFRSMSSSNLPTSSIPLFTTVASYREWRRKAFDEKKSVGFVPTMGALHAGHISLVRRSLAENDLTVVSIFVNPAQFAPHEDLSTYPRTLERDLEVLVAEKLDVSGATRSPSAVFLPSVQEMYPSGIVQDVGMQKGTFVEVKGYGHQMEGTSRPTFFRGVASVVTKLFNAVEPTNAYFGQKDIQQALLLKRLVRDLLLSHPDPAHLHIVPTSRDPTTSLALSSRNAYLSPQGLLKAPTLINLLRVAEQAWNAGEPKELCIQRALSFFHQERTRLGETDADSELKIDYVEMNDADSFEVLDANLTTSDKKTQPVILSGAMYIGQTRLIDNVILGDAHNILS